MTHSILIDDRTRCELAGAIQVVRRHVETGGTGAETDMTDVLGLLERILDTPPPPPPDWEIGSMEDWQKPHALPPTRLPAVGRILLGAATLVLLPVIAVVLIAYLVGDDVIDWIRNP